MTKTQEGLLKLLKEIDEICRANDLKFYLAGGTFIGAVRHAGFLPWDDDADIHMNREDYEKFCRIVEETRENRTVVSRDTHKDYPQIQPRYQALDKTTILRSTFATNTPQGQFVDIFVLDTATEREEDQQKLRDAFSMYCELTTELFTQSAMRSDEFFHTYTGYRFLSRIFGKEWAYAKWRKRFRSMLSPKSEYYHILSANVARPFQKKVNFGQPRYVPFEDTYLPVAERAEEVLFTRYGECWYEIPEIDEVVTHVFVEDQELPYTLYQESINQHIDTVSFMEDCRRRKNRWFKILPRRKDVNPQTYQLKGLPIVYEIEDFIEKNQIDLKAWIKDKRYQDLEALFSPYFAFIASDNSKRWNAVPKMKSELLYAALYPKVMQGNFGIARKMIKNLQAEETLTSDMALLLEYAEATGKILADLYTFKDYEDAWQVVEKYADRMPDNPYMARSRIKLLLLGMDPDAQITDIKEEIEEKLKIFAEDPELLKYKADLCWQQGQKEESVFIYRSVRDLIKNGIERMDLIDKLKTVEEVTC